MDEQQLEALRASIKEELKEQISKQVSGAVDRATENTLNKAMSQFQTSLAAHQEENAKKIEVIAKNQEDTAKNQEDMNKRFETFDHRLTEVLESFNKMNVRGNVVTPAAKSFVRSRDGQPSEKSARTGGPFSGIGYKDARGSNSSGGQAACEFEMELKFVRFNPITELVRAWGQIHALLPLSCEKGVGASSYARPSRILRLRFDSSDALHHVLRELKLLRAKDEDNLKFTDGRGFEQHVRYQHCATPREKDMGYVFSSTYCQVQKTVSDSELFKSHMKARLSTDRQSGALFAMPDTASWLLIWVDREGAVQHDPAVGAALGIEEKQASELKAVRSTAISARDRPLAS